MMRNLAALLIALSFAGTPGTAAGQTDWTFDLPVDITRLPSGVEDGAVLCAVGPAEIPQVYLQVLHGYVSQGASPGAPMVWHDDPRTDEGYFYGFQIFEIDAEGNAPPSVQVSIRAPESTTDAVKSRAGHWACGVGLRGQLFVEYSEETWHPVYPGQAPPVITELVGPLEGTGQALFISGTIPRN